MFSQQAQVVSLIIITLQGLEITGLLAGTAVTERNQRLSRDLCAAEKSVEKTDTGPSSIRSFIFHMEKRRSYFLAWLPPTGPQPAAPAIPPKGRGGFQDNSLSGWVQLWVFALWLRGAVNLKGCKSQLHEQQILCAPSLPPPPPPLSPIPHPFPDPCNLKMWFDETKGPFGAQTQECHFLAGQRFSAVTSVGLPPKGEKKKNPISTKLARCSGRAYIE